MNYRFCISIFALASFLIISLIGGPGCANIVPPAGGPRDTLPPKLRRVQPADSSRNFAENRIVFSFDEYIEVDNYMQNLIVSPTPTNIPTVTRKLNTMTVKLRDTLEANTTYSLNFGDAVRDVNEGNIYKNFTYVFTTGNYIDSLQFRGNVVMAETGETDSTITIMLHRSSVDSAVAKEKPRYIAKTDGKGNFVFRNLPPGTFYVYALKDQSGTYRYMNSDQVFAFADSAIVVSGHTPPVTLYAYSVPKKAEPPAAARPGRNTEKRLKFTTNLQNDRQDLLGKFQFQFEAPLHQFDSSKIRFTTDSTFNAVSGHHWEMDSTKKIFTLHYPWTENTLYHLILPKDFATDTLGRQLLKADTIDFTTRKTTEYGKLSIRFRNLDLSRNPVLLFVQGNELKGSFPLSSVQFNQALFTPGDYSLRILYDDNKNGVWDPGNFFTGRKQPEKVKPVLRKITVKANWDNEFEIDVDATVETNAPGPRGNQRVAPGRTRSLN